MICAGDVCTEDSFVLFTHSLSLSLTRFAVVILTLAMIALGLHERACRSFFLDGSSFLSLSLASLSSSSSRFTNQ